MLKEVDLLTAPFRVDGRIERQGEGFVSDAPWSWARYDDLSLKPGWWSLEWQGEAPANGAMVRISSPGDPGILLQLDRRGTRLRLQGQAKYHVAFLPSAWPGAYRFSQLRLRRLGATATFRLYAASARRLLTHKNPFGVLRNLLARALAGQALGIGSGGEPVEEKGDNQAKGAPGADDASVRRELSDAGVDAALLEGQSLHPDAASIILRAFDANPEWRAAYTDCWEGDRVLVRPEWDEVLAAEHEYVQGGIFVRRDASVSADFAGLREIVAAHGPRALGRIPLPLVKGAARTLRALTRPAAPATSGWPRVSAVIPTKDRLDLLEKCLIGLRDMTDYPDLEVVIVDNGCADPAFEERIKAAAGNIALKVVEDHGPFNFSRLINQGVAATSGEMLLLLNDDVEPIETGWLHRMVETAMDESVGAVGARLLYPDGSVQHGGVVIGIGGVCGHLWKGLKPEEAEANPYVALPSRRLAVTGACIALRADAFRQVGGLNEADFAVAFNDIDLCLRLHEAGLRTVYRGDSVLTHHESQSRGRDDEDVAKRARLMRETVAFLARWRGYVEHDPYGSPSLSLHSEDGSVDPSLRW